MKDYLCSALFSHYEKKLQDYFRTRTQKDDPEIPLRELLITLATGSAMF